MTNSSDPLADLQRKIDLAKSQMDAGKKAPSDNESPASIGQAMRFGVELFAGAATGGAMGYFLDRWLDSSPWGMIVFFFLGVGAGFRNLLRAAQEGQDESFK